MGQLKKRKSNRPLNPKPIGLRRMLFLVLQKDGREGFAGIRLPLTLHHIRTMTAVPFADDLTEEEEQDADCVLRCVLVFCVFCTGILRVLVWSFVCSELVFCMFCTGLLCVLYWSFLCSGRVFCVFCTGLLCVLYGSFL
jgi:hypothetical protein